MPRIHSVKLEAELAEFGICILTPRFYSRFASYISLKDSLEAEILSSNAEENLTAQVSNPEAFCDLLLSTASKSFPTISQARTTALLDHFLWLLVYFTRTPPPRGLYPRLGNPHLRTQANSRGSTAKVSSSRTSLSQRMHCAPSFLDSFVLDSCSQADRTAYRRALMRVFVSNRLAFGDERILKAYKVMLKLLIAAMAGRMMWVTVQGWRWC